MQTLEDVLREIRDIEDIQPIEDGWPRGYIPRAKLIVPSAKNLQLPHHQAGLLVDRESRKPLTSLSTIEMEAARFTLLSRPTMLVPLVTPTGSMLGELGYTSGGPQEKPHCAGIACAVRTPNDGLCFGQARVVIIENGVRLGSHKLLQYDDSWTTDLDEFVAMLGMQMGYATDNLRDGPEPNQPAWPRLVALVGGKQPDVSPGWQRHLRLAAGLLRVRLQIVFDADSQFKNVVASLTNRPPTGLLLWYSQLRHAEAYESSYKDARPDGLVDYFDPQPTADKAAVISDLVVHLRLMVDMDAPSTRPQLTWPDCKTEIEALESSYFVLSDRALGQLETNPYRDPRRMLDHVASLEKLAKAFSENSGGIGSRLADYATREVGIEIALTDGNLKPPSIFVKGESIPLKAMPHVKVDDHKRPDRCGRIYFAIDAKELRFIVDHIGLHDYGH